MDEKKIIYKMSVQKEYNSQAGNYDTPNTQVFSDILHDWAREWKLYDSCTFYIGRYMIIQQDDDYKDAYVIDFENNTYKVEKALDKIESFRDITYYKILVGNNDKNLAIKRISNINERALYFISLLLKFFHEEDIENKKLCIYSLNVLLKHDVFDINIQGKIRFRNGMDLIKCFDFLPDPILPNSIEDVKLKQQIKNYNFYKENLEQSVLECERLGKYNEAKFIKSRYPKPEIPKTEEELINEIDINNGECAFYHYLNEKMEEYIRKVSGRSLFYRKDESKKIDNYYGYVKKNQFLSQGVKLGACAIEIIRYGNVFRIIQKTTSKYNEIFNYEMNNAEKYSENGYFDHDERCEIEPRIKETVMREIDRLINNAKLSGAVASFDSETEEFIYEEAINIEKVTVERLFNFITDVYDRFDEDILGNNRYDY